MQSKKPDRPRLLSGRQTALVAAAVAAAVLILVCAGVFFYESPLFYGILAALVLLPYLLVRIGTRRASIRLEELDRAEEEAAEEEVFPPVPEALRDRPARRKR